MMAALPSIPMDEFLSKFPGVQTWIEQDIGWNIDEISDMTIDPEKCCASVTRRFSDGHETKSQYFTRLENGDWKKQYGYSEALSEEGYNHFPQGLRDWVEQDLQWKREEIVGFHIRYETLPDGYTIGEDGKKWAKWKHGKHADVTLERYTKEKYVARFVRLDDGNWQKKDDYNVTPLVGKA